METRNWCDTTGSRCRSSSEAKLLLERRDCRGVLVRHDVCLLPECRIFPARLCSSRSAAAKSCLTSGRKTLNLHFGIFHTAYENFGPQMFWTRQQKALRRVVGKTLKCILETFILHSKTLDRKIFGTCSQSCIRFAAGATELCFVRHRIHPAVVIVQV